MRICFISDTHGHHGKLDIPKCDLLIHCGDFTNYGAKNELESFNDWVSRLKILKRIKKCYIVPGNHDLSLEESSLSYYGSKHYLRDIDGILVNDGVEIDGISFWGFSYVPPCGGTWAFVRQEDQIDFLLRKPKEANRSIDVFISHSPPHGKLDVNLYNQHQGSTALDLTIDRLKPKYCFFGHLHENIGAAKSKGITYCNVAAAGMSLKAPIILDIFQKR